MLFTIAVVLASCQGKEDISFSTYCPIHYKSVSDWLVKLIYPRFFFDVHKILINIHDRFS